MQVFLLPAAVGSLTEVILAQDHVWLESLAAVHDSLDLGDDGILGAVVSPPVVSLDAPDHRPAQLHRVDPLPLQPHALHVVIANLEQQSYKVD